MTKLRAVSGAPRCRADCPGGSWVFLKSRLRLYSVRGLGMVSSLDNEGCDAAALSGLGPLATFAAAATLAFGLATQTALEQLGQIDHVGSLAFFVRLFGLHRLDLARLDLLVDQSHDLLLEIVVVIPRFPASGHILDQALGHVEFLLGQFRLPHLALQLRLVPAR